MKITFYIGEKSFDYNPEEDLKNGVTLPFVLEDTEGKEEAIPAPAEEPAQQMSDKFFWNEADIVWLDVPAKEAVKQPSKPKQSKKATKKTKKEL